MMTALHMTLTKNELFASREENFEMTGDLEDQFQCQCQKILIPTMADTYC